MADATAEFFAELGRRGHEPLLASTSGTLRFDLAEGRRLEHWYVTIEKGNRLGVARGLRCGRGGSPGQVALRQHGDRQGQRDGSRAARRLGTRGQPGAHHLVPTGLSRSTEASGQSLGLENQEERPMSTDLVQILDGNTFVVSDSRGDIEASLTDPTGLFSFDTRFLSKWVLTIDGQRLNALSTDDLQYFETRFFLVPGTGTVYVDSKLSVIRQRAVGDGFSETADDPEPRRKAGRAGGADRGRQRLRRSVRGQGRSEEEGHLREPRRTQPSGARVQARHVRARDVDLGDGPVKIDGNGLTFKVKIKPHGQWKTDLSVVTAYAAWGERRDRPKFAQMQTQARGNMARGLEKWLEAAPRLECDSDELKVTYRRSLVDLAALRFSTRTLPGRAACPRRACRGS